MLVDALRGTEHTPGYREDTRRLPTGRAARPQSVSETLATGSPGRSGDALSRSLVSAALGSRAQQAGASGFRSNVATAGEEVRKTGQNVAFKESCARPRDSMWSQAILGSIITEHKAKKVQNVRENWHYCWEDCTYYKATSGTVHCTTVALLWYTEE